MDFAEQQRRPTKHLVGFAMVVLMHILIGEPVDAVLGQGEVGMDGLESRA